MMDKIDVVKKIQEVGVCAVIRGKDAEEAMAMSDACIAGGVTIIELAFTTPQAHEVIAALSKKYADNPDVVIGAGSVVTKDIPDGYLAYGNPCRPVRRITEQDSQLRRMLSEDREYFKHNFKL